MSQEKASFLGDPTRQTPALSPPPSRTINSDFAAGVPAQDRKCEDRVKSSGPTKAARCDGAWPLNPEFNGHYRIERP